MHRNRTWTLDPPEWRTQRNRLLPIEGGDGSTLNLDFTKGVLDPRLTFNRLSTATFVNSSGYVEYAGANLFLQSENISSASWTDQAGASRLQVSITNPIGGATSTQVTSGTGSNAILQSPTYQAGLPHVIRIWVRAGTSSQIQLGVYTTSFVTGSISVVSGTATVSGTGLFNVTGLTSTWTQLQIVYTSLPASGAFLIYPDGAGAPVAGRTIYVWGAQLNPGSTAQTYYPTTTLAYHAPRFDYAPTNIGESKGLLIENQTENVCLNSQALTTGWLSANMNTPTNPAIADPFGGTSATWKLVAPISASALRGWRHAVVTLTAANYTFSFWAKAAEFDRIVLGDPGSGRGGCAFVLVGEGTTTVLPGSTTPTNPRIESFPGGWYRCSVTMLMLATTYAMGIAGYPSATTPNEYGATYVQTSLNGVYATGFQIELGSGASSYIPTGGSKVLRLLDSCSLTGTNFTSVFGDGSLGTIICSHEFPRTDCNFAHQPTPWAIGNYNAANARGFSYANYTGGIGGYGWVYTSASFGSATASAVSITKNKCALSYNGLAITAALNGTTASSTGSGTITISSATGFLIGYNSTGPTTGRDFINACISSIKVYPTQLTAAQLQTLTAPNYIAPTLDLNFLSMSSNTDLINSGLTFGRLSPATFVNSSGNVQFANANCFTYSNPGPSSPGWNGTGTVTWNGTGGFADPIGGTNAQSFNLGTTGSAIFNTAGTTVVSGITHTFSVWLRAASGTTNARIGSANTGVVSTITVTDTWQRFSCQYVTNGTNDGGAVYSQTGSPSATMYVWGAQIQPGSIVGDLIQTSGTQNYSTPRFDYSPTNIGQPRGLLIEGSATNYMLQSSSLTGYSVADMATPTAGSEPNPEGTANSALQIYATSGANTYHGFYRTLAAGPNTQITVSIWAKARNYTHLFLSDLFSARAAVRFNLTTGATDNNFGLGFVSAKATPFPNGWWRCEMVVNVTASTSYGWAFVGVPTGATLTGAGAQYAGTGNAADGIYCYGFQVEGGFGASSYIPTSSSSVIRVGDSCVMNNITALNYSTQTGSIYWRGIIYKQPTAYTTLIGFQTAIDQPTLETFGNVLSYFTAARGPGLTGGGGNEVSRAFTLNSTIRYASSVNTLTNPIISVNLNGSAGSVSKSGNGNMHAATRFVIGRQPTTSYEASYPSVTLEQIQYYPTTLLAHQLQALVS